MLTQDCGDVKFALFPYFIIGINSSVSVYSLYALKLSWLKFDIDEKIYFKKDL